MGEMGNCPVHCRMFSNIFGLYPLDARNTPAPYCDNQNVCKNCQISGLGGKQDHPQSLAENHWVRRYYLFFITCLNNFQIFKLVLENRKGRGTRDQVANIRWIIEKTREFQKNIYSCFIDYAKAFHCVDHNKLWKILKEMGIPDHLTCLLRNLYAGQEATVRT